uniref:Nodulin-related protein 1 n=1 Tax=Anthurium amnicola TaxID=1678845 RepID=A0A1D1Z682_9ARAE
MDPPSENKTVGPAGEAQPDTSELFSSAKLVAEAAQSCFQGGADKIEKGKVAGAAADLLGAASHYGKLEEKGYGEYVEKAETYLQQYGSTGSGGGGPVAEAAAAPASDSPAPTGDEKAESAKSGDGGGYGEYAKLAQGFLSGGGEAGGEAAKSEGGGSTEGLMKLAGGFFKY